VLKYAERIDTIETPRQKRKSINVRLKNVKTRMRAEVFPARIHGLGIIQRKNFRTESQGHFGKSSRPASGVQHRTP
jgi:hypothetical protein